MKIQADIWFWAQGQCPAEEFELASYELFEAGIQTLEELDTDVPEGGVMPDHPMAQALVKGMDFGVRPEVTRFRFFTDDLELRSRVVAEFPQFGWTVGEEAAQDWDQHWRERQVPVEVSPRLWVRPPWVPFVPPSPDCVVLELEAKSAFGTGEHESTALTVQLMEGMDWKGATLLDIGTGTGILAMFAQKLGARHTVVTEIDPVAVPCIVENFARNSCSAPQGFLGFLDCLNESAKFDAVVCNMIRSEVWPLRADIERLVRTGGSLILSGQLAAERHYIADEWFGAGRWTIADEKYQGEWWAVRATRTAKI
jgi:ribosomal protein L11 methyltransferase